VEQPLDGSKPCDASIVIGREINAFTKCASVPIHRYTITNLKQRLPDIALFDAPLEIVEYDVFHRLSDILVDIGREDRQFHFGGGRCPLTRGSHIFR
jgi:hypothetical protein